MTPNVAWIGFRNDSFPQFSLQFSSCIYLKFHFFFINLIFFFYRTYYLIFIIFSLRIPLIEINFCPEYRRLTKNMNSQKYSDSRFILCDNEFIFCIRVNASNFEPSALCDFSYHLLQSTTFYLATHYVDLFISFSLFIPS